MNPPDDVILKKILRQLKFLNFFVGLFGIITIAGLIIGGVALYQVISVATNSIHKIDSFQEQTKQSLNLQQQLCNNKDAKSFLQAQTSICN